ncbi:MAG: hypothetical protein HRU35_03640 [Rickettsiaceae bacterium]|nr:hypothetical protein [Rickettsiaceae bacterium]
MEQAVTSRFEFLANIFFNLFHKKNLVILIGKKGVMLTAFNRHQAIDSIYITKDLQNNIKQYTKFLKKYKKFYISFLIDSSESNSRHEVMPLLHSIIKVNPVEKYINNHLTKGDLVAYDVYNILHENEQESWETIITSTPNIPPLSLLLRHTILNSFKFSGVYFLALEFQEIVDYILNKSNNLDAANNLQIFVTILKSSDIKIVVKHKNDIMDESSIDFPQDKSDSYIQGTIEQIISDKLLIFANYIERLKLKVSIITLLDDDLKNLLQLTTFDKHQIISLSCNDIFYNTIKNDGKYFDNVIMDIFTKHKTYLAFNDTLRSITKLTMINSIVFKPFIGLITILLFVLASFKYQDILTQSETTILNKKYFQLSKEYQRIKKKYPDIDNINNLVDLYRFELLLEQPIKTPYNDLLSLVGLKHENINIEKINWQLIDKERIISGDERIKIVIDLVFRSNSSNVNQGIEILNQYVNHVKTLFHNYNTNYILDSTNIVQISKKIKISAKIVLTRKVENDDVK